MSAFQSPVAAAELRDLSRTDRRVLDLARTELDARGLAIERIERLPEAGGTKIHLAVGAVLWTGNITATARTAPGTEHRRIVRGWIEALTEELRRASEEPDGPDLTDPAVLAALRIRLLPAPPSRESLTFGYARTMAGLWEMLCLRRTDTLAVLSDQLLGEFEDIDHLRDIARRNMRQVPARLVDVSEGQEPVGVYALHGDNALVSSLMPLLPSLVSEEFGPGAAPEGLVVTAPSREMLLAVPAGDATPPDLLRAIPSVARQYVTGSGFPSLYLVTEDSMEVLELADTGSR